MQRRNFLKTVTAGPVLMAVGSTAAAVAIADAIEPLNVVTMGPLVLEELPVDDATPFETLWTAIRADDGYAWGWHCNLAMAFMDGGKITHYEANMGAACVMERFFGVDVTKFREWPYTEPGSKPGAHQSRAKALEELQNCIDIQRQPGNWDYEPYMQGLLNGMLLAEAILTGKSYAPVAAPKKWRNPEANNERKRREQETISRDRHRPTSV